MRRLLARVMVILQSCVWPCISVYLGTDCRAGSSANNLALLNFEYLASYLAIYLCAYDLECNQSMIPLSLPTSHSMHSILMHA